MLQCTYCRKDFSRGDALQRHLRNSCYNSKNEQPCVKPILKQEVMANPVKTVTQTGKGVDSKFQFKHPFCMMVVGPSQSGKTVWITNLLKERNERIYPSPKNIVYCYSFHQPKYTYLKSLIPDMIFNRGIPENLLEDEEVKDAIIILDDMMTDVMKDTRIVDLFTKGSHHRKLSVILVLQNLYHQDKGSRTISLNSQYLVLFKNPRDRQQVETLARQMYPRQWRTFMKTFERETEQPHSHIILDFHLKTPEQERVRTGLLFDKELPVKNTPEELKKLNEKLQKLIDKKLTPEEILIEKTTQNMEKIWNNTNLTREEKVRKHTEFLNQIRILEKNKKPPLPISYQLNPQPLKSGEPEKKKPRTSDEIERDSLDSDTEKELASWIPDETDEKPIQSIKETRSPYLTRSRSEKILPRQMTEEEQRKTIADYLNTSKGKRYPSLADDDF